MVKFTAKEFVILILAIFFISIITASFYVGEPSFSITKEYGPGEAIRGWVNLSFDNELAISKFEDSFGNYISLITILNSNNFQNQEDYSCNPVDCKTDYQTLSGNSQKEIILDKGNSSVLGLRISGNEITDISKFSMKINSNASSSEEKQLSINILNDDEIDFQSRKASGNFQEKKYSCFVSEDTKGKAEITTTPYCQKFSLKNSPNVKIGANIEKVSSSGEVNFEFTIYNNDNYETCTATTSSSGEISCIPDLTINKPQDFFVCINTKNSADNNQYAVNYEENNTCGFSGIFDNKYNFDFEIFAQQGIYDEVGDFVLNKTELEKSGVYNIEDKIFDYLYTKYKNKCSDECVIPIKFTSNVNNQKIDISNISLSYTSGISTTTHEVYDLTEEPAQISSDYVKIDLNNANFSAPDTFGNYTFSLQFNNQQIFSEEIIVKKIPVIQSLNPETTIASIPTTFNVNVESFGKNITKYEWIFGNLSARITSENKIKYTYDSTGTYNLKVKVFDSEGLNSEKTFTISVKTPINAVNNTLQQKKSYIENIKTKLQDYNVFTRNSLYEVLNLTENENSLDKIQNDFSLAVKNNQTSNQTYIDLMQDLIKIEIPNSIETTQSGDSLTYYPDEEVIDLAVLLEVTGDVFKKSDVLNWHVSYIDSKLTFKEISGTYGSSKKPILNVFDMNLEKKNSGESIIFLENLENIKFKENYFENSKDNYFYTDFNKNKMLMSFFTTEDVDFTNLPLFVTPENLESAEIPEAEGKDYASLMVLIIILLVLLGIVVYIVMQTWYKKKYEKHLFKNKNDLYNLATYIHSAKKRGVSAGKIKENLKKSHWNSEQVRYAVKKYAEKRTGMLEIPIDEWVEKITRKTKHKKSSNKKGEIPFGIKIISIYYYISGALSIILWLLIIFAGRMMGGIIGMENFPFSLFLISGIIGVIMGIFTIFVGSNLRKRKNWAKIVVIIFSLMGIIGGINILIQNYIILSIISLAISSPILFYLSFSKKSKEFFGK